MFRVESPRPRREHRPTAQDAPDTSASSLGDPAARRTRTKAFHTGRGKRQNRGATHAAVPGRTLPQKPKWRHTSALYTQTGTGTILSSSITGSELYNANISGVP